MKDDDEFKLLSPEELQSAEKDRDKKQMIDTITKTLNNVSKLLIFLACLPNTLGSVEGVESNLGLRNLIHRHMMVVLKRTRGTPKSL